MECLRTPLGAGAKGVKEDGEKGGEGEFRVYNGMTLSLCDPAVSSIMWLLVRLGEGVDPSVRRERVEFNITSSVCVSYSRQHRTSVSKTPETSDSAEVVLTSVFLFSITYSLCHVSPLSRLMLPLSVQLDSALQRWVYQNICRLQLQTDNRVTHK